MAPRKSSSKKSVRKSSPNKKTVRKSSTMKVSSVKDTPKQSMMKQHGKKLAALAALLATAGAGAGFETQYRKNLTYGGAGPTRLEYIKSLLPKRK